MKGKLRGTKKSQNKVPFSGKQPRIDPEAGGKNGTGREQKKRVKVRGEKGAAELLKVLLVSCTGHTDRPPPGGDAEKKGIPGSARKRGV